MDKPLSRTRGQQKHSLFTRARLPHYGLAYVLQLHSGGCESGHSTVTSLAAGRVARRVLDNGLSMFPPRQRNGVGHTHADLVMRAAMRGLG